MEDCYAFSHYKPWKCTHLKLKYTFSDSVSCVLPHIVMSEPGRGHQQWPGVTMVTRTGSPTAPGGRAWSQGLSPHHRMRGAGAVKKRAKHHGFEIQIRSGAVDAMAIEAI